MDESRAVRNHQTAQCKAVMRLVGSSPHVLYLDGTPIDKTPMDLFPVLQSIDPDRWSNRYEFGFRYCAPRKTPWGIKFTGATRTQELFGLLRESCMVRRTQEEVLKDLPPHGREVVVLPMSDPKEYQKAEREFVKWLLSRGKTKAARAAQSAERLVQMGFLKRLAARLKFPALRDWVQTFLDESGEKLVVFCIHRGMARGLRTCFPGCALVTGDVVGKLRMAEIDRFNNDPKCRLFVGNIRAAGSGWSCTSASTTLFAEMDWLPTSHTQAELRTRGIGRGTGRRSRAVYTVASDSLEEKLCSVLQKRQISANKVLDGESNAGGVNDLLDLLESQLLGRRK